MKTSILLKFLVINISLFLIYGCGDNVEYRVIKPVPFPNTGIPGFIFPTDSNTINAWVESENTKEIYKHGWGLWAGLTASTDQVVGGETLLTYETWLTPSEILDIINDKPINRLGRANLRRPNQFDHVKLLSGKDPDTTVAESVAYSPASAKYAIKNKSFLNTTLAQYAINGMTSIPDFPADGITIKPVFKVISKNKLNNNLYEMPVWSGPIDSIAGFPESKWNSCVYVDINNNGMGRGNIDLGCVGASPSTTYNLSDFIYYTLNDEDAAYFNKEFSSIHAVPGDYAILVAMHVTSKEIKRWTWQTFWWTPNANNPPPPSSSDIANLRPLEYLNGAASHYAMSAAYNMVSPPQPYSGGQNVGDTVIAFNPYLEAGFDSGVFAGSNSYVGNIPTDAGVRTNCMSCHIYAAVDAFDLKNTGPYSGDAYVSLNDSIFNDKIKTDFAWSIIYNLDTTGMAEFIQENK